jgi:hypothetical protein
MKALSMNSSQVALAIRQLDSSPVVNVGQSRLNNAGRGVFATANILSSQAVCYYHGRHVPTDTPIPEIEEQYTLTLDDGMTKIVGFIVPQRGHPSGVAQLINEAFKPRLDEPVDQPDNELSIDPDMARNVCRAMAEYFFESRRRMNVAPIPGTNPPIFCAVRNIRVGEELYWPYGCLYWIERVTHRTFVNSGRWIYHMFLEHNSDTDDDPEDTWLRLANANYIPTDAV